MSISAGITVTAAGPQPTPPVVLWANLIALVGEINAGYSVLPSGLIEDIASTDTYALALIDAACVELINSLSPLTANPWLLVQLGQIYGVVQGVTANGSAYVVFTSNTPGFQVTPGWLVEDSNGYQYAVQEGTVIGSDGMSALTFVVASQSGIWGIPANSITQTITQPPGGSGVTISVTNPEPGTPQAAPETEWEYRLRALAAGLVTSQGTPSILKTALGNVSGVQPRLISVQLQSGRGWEIIVGGGDPYAVANAIFGSGIDLSTLVGSLTQIEEATLANPCVITTNINHGYTNHESVVISGALGLTPINGTWTIGTTSFLNEFKITLNTSSDMPYAGGGVVTPNNGALRNITVDLDSYPDTYPVTFVNPPAQVVTVQLTYYTISPNFVSSAAVQQLGAPAIANSINSIPVGAPLNINALSAAFTASVLSLFGNNISLISELVWTISVDGVEMAPEGASFLIETDPESYYTCVSSAVTISQG